MKETNNLLNKKDTDFVKENMMFNYCLGDDGSMLIESFIRNNDIQTHFNINNYYFMIIGRHKKYNSFDTVEDLQSRVSYTLELFDLFQNTLKEYGYNGNTFIIKADNSKQFGILFSPETQAILMPDNIVRQIYEKYCFFYDELKIERTPLYSASFVGPYSGFEQIHQAFLDARELNDLIFFGIRDIVITKEYRDKMARPCDVTAILGNVRRLTNTVCTGTLSQVLRQTDYIIRELVAPSYIMSNFSTLFSAVDDLLGMLETVYTDHIRITRRAQETFFTLEDYRIYLRETLTAIFAQLRGVPRYSPTLLMALSYINRNYARELSLTQLSEYVYANASTLSTEFNNEVGMSLSEYVTGLRVRRAQELLKTTNLTVPQIAEAVGFSGVKYFREIFKKQTGQSPQGYRDGREL